MIKIGLVPLGKIEEDLLAFLAVQVKEKLKREDIAVEIYPPVSPPEKNTAALALVRLKTIWTDDQKRFLVGLIDADLTETEEEYFFSRQETGNRMTMVALARLRPDFYKLPANEAVFQARLLKLVLRELSVLLGLGLCQDKKCLMSYARNLHELDIKYPSFCLDCWLKFNTWMSKR